jgi:hypothetical protein
MDYRIKNPTIPDQSTGDGVMELDAQLRAKGATGWGYSFSDDTLTVSGPEGMDLSAFGVVEDG